MKRLEERCCRKDVPTGPQDSKHLSDGKLWTVKVLKDCFAVQNTDAVYLEGEQMRICNHVNVWEWREIEVQKAGMSAQRPAANRYGGTFGFAHCYVERLNRLPASRRIDLPEATRE